MGRSVSLGLFLLASSLAFETGLAASRAPVRGARAMVVTTEPRATQIGIDVLQSGGNAVDAAVAVGFALAVTHPSAGNLGGGGFMMIRLARTGETVAIDYREMAPGRSSRAMYQDAEGNVDPDASSIGYRASGVPGTVAGLALALEKYGTRKLPQLLAPAIALARDGVELSFYESRSLERSAKLLERFPESRRVYLRDGSFYREGERFAQPDLARTLEAIAAEGPRGFYAGTVAHKIAEDMARSGGVIGLEDLKAYRAVVRRPLEGSYRGLTVHVMPPPSSGGVALLEMLNILETYPLDRYGQGSSRTLHLLAESMRRAFADRAEFLADPDFVKVPVSGLTSKRFAAERRASIDPFLASQSVSVQHGAPAAYESEQTTHFSIVDADGNAVANTYTLNGSYGSGVTIAGTGVLMNNEMDDFSSKPGFPNRDGLIYGEANAIAPRKRPLSSMTPTMVTRDGKLYLVLGSPGGPTIINTVLQTLVNVVDFHLTVQEAVDAPRMHHQWIPDRIALEEKGFAADVVEALRARGHAIELRRSIGDCHAILIDSESGVRLGAPDSRNDGKALGY